jgi:cobalt-zinc-cadmium efflux system membrane fusion protein
MTPRLTAIALVALLAIASGSCRRSGASQETAAGDVSAGPVRSGNTVRFESSSPQLERIRVVPVTEATLAVDEFDLPAKVEAIPTRLAKVALPLSGRVQQVLVTFGEHVTRGQPLLTVDAPDSSSLQSALRQAQADVKHRQAAVAKAEADLSRANDLFANRAIARKDVMSAEASLSEATATLEQARATEDDVTRRLRLAGVDLEKSGGLMTVRSPMDGEVVELSVAPGEYRDDTAAPVMTVADLSRVWAVAAVPESRLADVQTKQRVVISIAAYPEQVFEGRVERVAGELDPETRTARVIVELDNARRLFKPEMFARVRYSGPVQAVITVPMGAILHDTQHTSVFVERGRGTFERRDVSLGPRHDDVIVVTGGLAAGDRVVTEGTMLLVAQ